MGNYVYNDQSADSYHNREYLPTVEATVGRLPLSGYQLRWLPICLGADHVSRFETLFI